MFPIRPKRRFLSILGRFLRSGLPGSLVFPRRRQVNAEKQASREEEEAHLGRQAEEDVPLPVDLFEGLPDFSGSPMRDIISFFDY